MFGKKKEAEAEAPLAPQPDHSYRTVPTLFVAGTLNAPCSAPFGAPFTEAPLATIAAELGKHQISERFGLKTALSVKMFEPDSLGQAIAVLAIFQTPEQLDAILDALIAQRRTRDDGSPVLIIATQLSALTALGAWLHKRAVAEALEGIRLIASNSLEDIVSQLPSRLAPITDISCIKMPVSTEVDNKQFKYFYTISDSLRALCRHLRELAQNNITRVYFLGGPGTGKTSLAYYFWLCRGKGNFITVNLNSETTDDKAAMKSLLCGHVTGAFPGAQSREGALSFARDGVCFLDESHGVSGQVMQVLMECLENNQYLPYGATAKRAVDCAVLFASNRSWQTLRSLIHLDEHARLGATVAKITDLAARPEDMIAVMSATLAGFQKRFTTWKAPLGLTAEAWELIRQCPWRGHTRTLMRVTESAVLSFVKSANSDKSANDLIDATHLQEALQLWEPNDAHKDDGLYTSFQDDSTPVS